MTSDFSRKRSSIVMLPQLALLGAGLVSTGLAGCAGGDSGPQSSVSGTGGGSPGVGGTGAVIIGATATAAAPTSKGVAQLIYIPNVQSVTVADRSAAAGNAVTLNHTFTNPTGGTASANFTGTLKGGTTVLGTGVLGNGVSVPGDNQFYWGPNGTAMLYMTHKYWDPASGGYLPLTDSKFGIVQLAQTGNGTQNGAPLTQGAIGGLYTGNPTPVAQLPVQATYAGSIVGLAAKPGTVLGTVTMAGNMTLNANLTQGTVTGSAPKIVTSLTAFPGYGLAFDGKITGNTYAGTVAFTTPTGGAVTAPTSSALTGGFFGPGGAETAGSFRIDGQAPDSTGKMVGTIVVGSFGAHK
jgi:C-lobe and N-lobe beta barrels of Tf-binding protein B